MGSQLAQRKSSNKIEDVPIILGCISVDGGDGAGARSGSGGPGSVGAAGRRPNKLFTYSILEHSRYVDVGAGYSTEGKYAPKQLFGSEIYIVLPTPNWLPGCCFAGEPLVEGLAEPP